MVFIYKCVCCMCVLQWSLKEVLGKLETIDADQANEHLERILYIYHTLVEHRKGAKITKPQSVCEVCMCVFLYHSKALFGRA